MVFHFQGTELSGRVEDVPTIEDVKMGVVPKSLQLLADVVIRVRVGSEGVEVAQLQLPHFGSFVFAQFFLLLTDPAPGSFEEVR